MQTERRETHRIRRIDPDVIHALLIPLSIKWFFILVFYLNYKHQSLDDFAFLFGVFEATFGSWLPAIYRYYDCLLESGAESIAHYILLTYSISWLVFIFSAIWVISIFIYTTHWVFPNMKYSEKKDFIDRYAAFERSLGEQTNSIIQRFSMYLLYIVLLFMIYVSIFGDFDEERLCGLDEIEIVPAGLSILLLLPAISGSVIIARRTAAKLRAEGVS